MIQVLVAILAGLLLAPLAGGLVTGIDRKLTARLQSRFGPPILQPFFDLLKLFGKKARAVNAMQVFCAVVYVVAAALSVVLFLMRSDLLIIFFVQAVGAVFVILGGYAVASPYAQVGAQREMLQVLAYEPILILVFAGFYLVTGSFQISAIDAYAAAGGKPLLVKMPLLFLALGYGLAIKLRKSPFDLSTSHHGHQELVKGLTTEFSGPYLGLLELGHWFEVALILGLTTLFWSNSLLGMAVVAGGAYFLEILTDNVTARLTWRAMLGKIWVSGLVMCVLNLVWLAGGKAVP